MKNKTNKELLAWIDGYLKAHIDDGLTTQQIAKILDEISKETIEISPLPNFPYFEPNPIYKDQFYTTRPYTGDNTSP